MHKSKLLLTNIRKLKIALIYAYEILHIILWNKTIYIYVIPQTSRLSLRNSWMLIFSPVMDNFLLSRSSPKDENILSVSLLQIFGHSSKRLAGKSKPNIAISISMPTTGLKSRILRVRAAETHYWTLGIKPNRWKISVCLLDIIKKCWPISWFLCWEIMICESYEDVIYCVCFKLRVRTVNDLL